MKNPYVDMIHFFKHIANENMPEGMFLGTITNLNPLILKVGDLSISKEYIKINECLLPHSRKVTVDSNSLNIKNKDMLINTMLQQGNEVVGLMTKDAQNYIILCKVV